MKKKDKEKAMRYSIYDGSAYSAGVSFGERMASAFALFKGATNEYLGYFTTIPQLFAALTQLLSPYVMRKLGKRKELVCYGALFNALSWVFIGATAFLPPEEALRLLIVFFTIYYITNALTSAPWSSWMGQIVPRRIRGEYFGKRTSIAMFVSLLASLFVAWIMRVLEGKEMKAFLILFSLAFLSRMISAYFLFKIPEPKYKARETIFKWPWEILKKRGMLSNAIKYSFLFHIAVYVAAPYVIAYLLKYVKLSYFDYTLVVFASLLGHVIASRYWGKVIDHFGVRIVVALTAFAIAIVPFLFLISMEKWHFWMSGFLSGFAWSGFDLGMFNYILGGVREKERSTYVGNYNFLISVGRFLGANIGVVFINYYKPEYFFGIHILPTLLIASAILRFLVSVAMATGIKEMETIKREDEVMKVLLYPIEKSRFHILGH